MLKIILVDDERSALDLLERMLSENPAVKVIGKFQKTSEALLNIALLKLDTVYLDIEMPMMNGIELASQIYDIDLGVEIIFLTAYNSYALQAFEVNALDYVQKPIMEERLDKSIKRLCKRKAVQKETENAAIDGATGRTYTLIGADAGKLISFEVTLKTTGIPNGSSTHC